MQENDTTVTHKRGALNTNTDCLCRFPKDAPNHEPISLDWKKGDYNNSLAIVFAFMGIAQLDDAGPPSSENTKTKRN